MKRCWARLLRDEGGATAIEYGILAGLISVAIITIVSLTGTQLVNVFTTIQTQLATI